MKKIMETFTINDFFNEQNEITNINEEAYHHIEDIRETIDSCTRTSDECFYIIDYHKRNFLHVSDNPTYFGGLSAEKIKEMGYKFYLHFVPEEEIKMLIDINHVSLSYFNQLPNNEKPHYFISYNIHIKNRNHKILVNHRLTPLKLYNGKIWLALCSISPATNKVVGKVYLHRQKSLDTIYYSLQNKSWEKFSFARLNDIEKRIFLYSIQGLATKQPAEKGCRSEIAVKKTRSKLLEMLNANNFQEAIHLALLYKLL